MTNEMVKFTAEVAKGISVGTKEVTIKLLIPLTAVESKLSSLAKMQEKEVMVYLGDPQGAFDFDDEDRDPMYNTWDGGRRVTTDASGVVTQIEKPGSEPEQDDNQAQMFGPDGEPIQPEESTGEGQKSENEQPTVPPTDGEDPGTDPNDPYGDNDDIPAWMKEGGDDQSKSKEMDFTSEGGEGGQQPSADQNENGQTDAEKENAAEISKEELEQFILAQRPIFEDIKLADSPADFPALLQMKNEGKTWLEISREMKVPSSQISSKLNVYKKRVTKMMQDGVAV
ncbi:hypothetical protein DC345_04900 [Paenibacillus taichungensis]|uniref:Uncharacterized protein n=1 Tax=Paenibacillus taichungensis TaxID=484184 RepID=A0A329R4K8_9BACL|nr:hypothetical protein [Paenibacillus taichungensis]RAW18472.1 hypothetical protein DC345_04900 [Paenibacillus taichungensis]